MVRAFAFVVSMACATGAFAQVFCQEYRLVYQTVYDQQEITAFRIETETIYEEQKQTTYRPVWETEMRQRRYTVSRLVTETSEREERYRVLRPVWETQMRDTSYDVVRQVVETSEREERYIVQRPVWETSEREETYTVMRPVTTYTTNYVDQGGFVDQQVVTPGATRTRLRWLPHGCVVDPLTGASTFQRGGLTWVPEQGPARVETFRVWQPNIVAQQVPQTTYVPQVMTRKVLVQVCRMVQEEHVRRVPVTTYRQVVERVRQQTPVQVCRMVEEERVRRIPVTTYRIVTEERVEQIPVQVCKMVAFEQTVQIPRLVEKRIPVKYVRQVPRVVVMRVPIDPCPPDPCYGLPTVITSPAPTPMIVPPPAGTFQPQEPTPAAPRQGAERPTDAAEAPSLSPEDKMGPVDEETEGQQDQQGESAAPDPNDSNI